MNSTALSGYTRLEGAVPVVYVPQARERAGEVRRLLEAGSEALSDALEMETPALEAMLVTEADRDKAPRENSRAYPAGFPYFTRSAQPPVLVLPDRLSPVFKPRTAAAYPLAAWHELAHAFLLQREVVKTPAWLGELVPQASSATVARRTGSPLQEHLAQIDCEPGFTIQGLQGQTGAEQQMDFQNLLLLLGAAALEEFGEGFLRRIVHTLWAETDPVGERRAEEMLANALGPGGRDWLRSRPEFREEV